MCLSKMETNILNLYIDLILIVQRVSQYILEPKSFNGNYSIEFYKTDIFFKNRGIQKGALFPPASGVIFHAWAYTSEFRI